MNRNDDEQPRKPLTQLTAADEAMFKEMDDLLLDMGETNRMLADYARGVHPADIHDDAPLKLEDAICLPELQGYFAVNPDLRIPSESLSIKTLRKAIGDGHLAVVRPNTKNLYVTRRAIKEWLISCLDQGNPHVFVSVKSDIKTVGSRTKPFGLSTTATTSRIAQDAAEMTLKALKESSVSTSSKNTRTKS